MLQDIMLGLAQPHTVQVAQDLEREAALRSTTMPWSEWKFTTNAFHCIFKRKSQELIFFHLVSEGN